MVRTVASLALCLFLAQALGAGALIELVDGCDGCCPEEGHCLPSCPSCMCFPGVRPVLASSAVDVAGPQDHGVMVAEAAELLVAPDPREILHVPKLLA
jgi:hypothetical protein